MKFIILIYKNKLLYFMKYYNFQIIKLFNKIIIYKGKLHKYK